MARMRGAPRRWPRCCGDRWHGSRREALECADDAFGDESLLVSEPRLPRRRRAAENGCEQTRLAGRVRDRLRSRVRRVERARRGSYRRRRGGGSGDGKRSETQRRGTRTRHARRRSPSQRIPARRPGWSPRPSRDRAHRKVAMAVAVRSRGPPRLCSRGGSRSRAPHQGSSSGGRGHPQAG